MRYAFLLAALAGFALTAESALAQQTVLPPLVTNGYMVQNTVGQNTVDVSTAAFSAPRKTLGEVTPCSFAPDTCSTLLDESCCKTTPSSRWFVSMEYLYWQTIRTATPYAGILNRPSGTFHGLPIDSSASFTSELRDTDYVRNSGFRSNIAYRITDRFDVGFRYTFFYTNGVSSLGNPNLHTNSILANRLDRSLADNILNTTFDDGEADFATQQIKLNLSIYDIELRRRVYLDSRRFDAHLMCGFRFAGIDQASQIRYQNLDSGNVLVADTDEFIDMCAAGLLFGGDVKYDMGWHTSVFARGSVALLYANFDISRTDMQTSATAAGVRSISERFQNVLPVVDINVGVRWERNGFYAAVGYNVAHWFDMVQGLDAIFQDDVDGNTNSYRTERGVLSFDGFFLETGVLF